MEDMMRKAFITVAAATAIVSASLISAQAGGGATSAAQKYSNLDRHSQQARVGITEFSSSSAPIKHGPKR
jgi:hypothetical protein